MRSCRLKGGHGSQGEHWLKKTVRTVKVRFSRKYEAHLRGESSYKQKVPANFINMKNSRLKVFASLRPFFKGSVFSRLV